MTPGGHRLSPKRRCAAGNAVRGWINKAVRSQVLSRCVEPAWRSGNLSSLTPPWSCLQLRVAAHRSLPVGLQSVRLSILADNFATGSHDQQGVDSFIPLSNHPAESGWPRCHSFAVGYRLLPVRLLGIAVGWRAGVDTRRIDWFWVGPGRQLPFSILSSLVGFVLLVACRR